jgi:hypothetical protein
MFQSAQPAMRLMPEPPVRAASGTAPAAASRVERISSLSIVVA